MNIRTTDFGALAASAPLDRQASVVRDGSGDQWDTEVPGFHKRWLGPPALRPYASLDQPARAAHSELVGQRFGRLVCIGLLADDVGNAKGSWVCRCDCGYYEARKAKALRNALAETHMCLVCYRADKLRQRAAKPSTKASRRNSAKLLDRIARAARA